MAKGDRTGNRKTREQRRTIKVPELGYYLIVTDLSLIHICVGNPITATYALEGDEIDIELLMPVDNTINSTDKFDFKNQIKIVNAVVASYIGHPMRLQDACNQLNQYIMERRLQPITVGYNAVSYTHLKELQKRV